MAHRKAGGSAKSLRTSNPKYLGLKVGDGQEVQSGVVLVRQKGIDILPGKNVAVGRDHTLFSKASGIVRFAKRRKTNFTGHSRRRSEVRIEEKS